MRTSLSPGANLSILSTYSLALSCLPLSHRYIPALYSAWSQQAQWRHVRLYIGIYIHVQVSMYTCFPQRRVSVYPPPFLHYFQILYLEVLHVPKKNNP